MPLNQVLQQLQKMQFFLGEPNLLLLLLFWEDEVYLVSAEGELVGHHPRSVLMFCLLS